MDDLKSAQWWVAKGSSIGLTGMSMLRSAEGNGRQAREPNMASKACLASSARPKHSQQHRMRVQLTQHAAAP